MSYKKITVVEFNNEDQATVEYISTMRKIVKEDFTRKLAEKHMKGTMTKGNSYTVSAGGRTYLLRN